MIKYPYRYVARLYLKTNSPLQVGAGKSGLENEALVATDANGLPFIPGTSLAGVLKHHLEENEPQVDTADFFGDQTEGKDEGRASRIQFTSALLLDKEGKSVIEGLKGHALEGDPYYSSLTDLPERDRVRIRHTGAAADKGKFIERLVPQGLTFLFEICLIGTDQDEEEFKNKILAAFKHPTFRIGGGSRNGRGKFELAKILYRRYKLSVDPDGQMADLEAYLEKSSSLNDPFDGSKPLTLEENEAGGWRKIGIILKPRDYFVFGSGEWEQKERIIKASTETKEQKKEYSWITQLPKREIHLNENGKFEKNYIIPATSFKGILSHRLAFHYNKLSGNSIEKVHFQPLRGYSDENVKIKEEIEREISSLLKRLAHANDTTEVARIEEELNSLTLDSFPAWEGIQAASQKRVFDPDEHLPVQNQNDAVRSLFGYSTDTNKENAGSQGNILFSDINLDQALVNDKISFMHVSIDRFTGGGREGALFEEKVLAYSGTLETEIWVKESALEDPKIQEAFYLTLDDLEKGLLPFGANVAKGHGHFTAAYSPKRKTNDDKQES